MLQSLAGVPAPTLLLGSYDKQGTPLSSAKLPVLLWISLRTPGTKVRPLQG